MVGPFMQGMLLMGIIYWYSKGLFNLINDYYRGEFNRKLKNEYQEQKMVQFKSQTYDFNDMEELINIEMNKETIAKSEENMLRANDLKYLDMSSGSELSVCYKLNRKKEFLNILYTIIYKYYKSHLTKNPICWLNENNISYNYTNSNLYADMSEKI